MISIVTAETRQFHCSEFAHALQSAMLFRSSTLVVQFLKGGIDQGPENPVTLGTDFSWVRAAMPGCISGPGDFPAVTELWDFVKDEIVSGKWQRFIFDELCLAVSFELLNAESVVSVLKSISSQVDVVLTGAGVPEELNSLANKLTIVRSL